MRFVSDIRNDYSISLLNDWVLMLEDYDNNEKMNIVSFMRAIIATLRFLPVFTYSSPPNSSLCKVARPVCT